MKSGELCVFNKHNRTTVVYVGAIPTIATINFVQGPHLAVPLVIEPRYTYALLVYKNGSVRLRWVETRDISST